MDIEGNCESLASKSDNIEASNCLKTSQFLQERSLNDIKLDDKSDELNPMINEEIEEFGQSIITEENVIRKQPTKNRVAGDARGLEECVLFVAGVGDNQNDFKTDAFVEPTSDDCCDCGDGDCCCADCDCDCGDCNLQ